MALQIASGLELRAELRPDYQDILTPDALGFIADLQRKFGGIRERLLAARRERQTAFDHGERPDFLQETAAIREKHWTIGPSPIPKDLQDRRVEITGPVERKMMINALNSGAGAFMADFEDATVPTWDNIVQGQINLYDALNGVIDYSAPDGRLYTLNEEVATLIVRPRGWHMLEKHVFVDGEPVSASLFDFGLYFYHNIRHFLGDDSGCFLYLPKLESHVEARLWNDVFSYAEDSMALPRGKIKATVLIETITAAFEMDEILWELREHVAGLNCGRWDYIFSFIKKFCNDPRYVLPERAQVTMSTPFLRAYSQLLIKTCHRRGAYAMGGMAAQIPVKDDPDANEAALAKVREDKEREAQDGHDGTWVAHPALVPVALEVFDRYLGAARVLHDEHNKLIPGAHDMYAHPKEGPNQLGVLREDVQVTAADLLAVPGGTITEAGLRNNVSVALHYLAAWLGGTGSVPLNNLMEDAATAEIARTQLWQWLHHQVKLDDGRTLTPALYEQMLAEEMQRTEQTAGADRLASGHYQRAADLLTKVVVSEELTEFLTLVAYDYV